MAHKYLSELSAIVDGAALNRFPGIKLECKHFFSGAALYAAGNICVSLTPVGLALKLPERDRTLLVTKHDARPLRYFPNGPIKKGYVVLSGKTAKNTRALRRWIRASIEYSANVNRGPAHRKP